MPWWKKTVWPAELEVVAGKVSVRVYLHDIDSSNGPISCWSYVSHGLAAMDQSEIVFTLRRDPDEPSDAYPHDPLHLLATIYRLADDGQRVGPGDVTEFGDRSFLGHHLLYVEAQPLDQVPLPPSCLAALLVTADELRAVREFGATRVLARMGHASHHYPFPPWVDRRRPGLRFERVFEDSVLSKIPCAVQPDVCAVVEDNRIVVSALRGSQPPWRDRLADLPDESPFALLTALDPAANGCLVWVPGQSGPEAITPPGSDGSRLCGCFVAFLPEQPESGGRLFEDGFVMELTADSWKDVRSALTAGREVSVAGGGMSFALTWRSQEKVTADTVAIKQVRLLTSEHEMASRCSVDDVAAFCQEVQRCAKRTVGGREAAELLIRVRCTPEGHDVDLASRGDVSQPVMQAFYEAVQQLATLPVRDGEVSFEIELTVSA